LISIFAQTTEYTPPSAIASWLECAFWLAAFIAAIAVAKAYLFPRHDKGVPQPLVITPQASYADKVATEARFAAVEAKIEESRKENKTEMDKLRIEALDGRRRLHNDIEEVPAKVIRLLRDTKGLLDT
jgi:hypothetical protein